MGQDQSRDSSTVPFTQTNLLPSMPPEMWCPCVMDGVVILRRRVDGSSVKELYIPEWRVSFFKSNGTIDILTDCVNSGGKKVKISAENSLLLYNAWVIHVDSKRVLHSTLPLVTQHLDSSSKL